MTTKVNTQIGGDVPIPKQVIQITEREMTRHGYDVSLLEQCQIPEHSSLQTGWGRIPTFMTDDTSTSELVRNGTAFPFSIEKQIKGHFGESTGSSNVTTFFVQDDMSIPEVIEELHVSGQIDEACQKIEPFIAEDVSAIEVVSYAIATYAKGWLAEMILSGHDRFSKGSVSQDEGGIDMFDNRYSQGDDKYERQVKCVTVDKQVSGWLYYQWDMRGGLHFGDDYLSVHEHAAEVTDVPLTVTRRCHNSYRDDNGNTYRYIWW